MASRTRAAPRAPSDTVAVTPRSALARACEARFQPEGSELTSIQLPDPDSRGRMLFSESAEGGAIRYPEAKIA